MCEKGVGLISYGVPHKNWLGEFGAPAPGFTYNVREIERGGFS
jgi:hypothetical protein